MIIIIGTYLTISLRIPLPLLLIDDQLHNRLSLYVQRIYKELDIEIKQERGINQLKR